MVNYQCYRCGYTIDNKTKIKNHLSRKTRCKLILSNIDLDDVIEFILEGLSYIEYNKFLKTNKNEPKPVQNSPKPVQNSPKPVQNSPKPVENCSISENNDISDISEDSNEILIENDKLKCRHCKKLFLKKEYLETHLKKNCKMLIEFNNIYVFDKKTFGKNIYKNSENAGDIYIIQTDYVNNDHYKIGITNNIQKRLGQYRCGNTYEPRLYYYISCNDIRSIDKDLNDGLIKYKVKREIFKGNVEEIKNTIIDIVKKKCNISDVHVNEPDIKIGDLTECKFCNKYFYTRKDLFNHFNSCEEYKIFLSKDKDKDKDKDNNKCLYCNKIYKHVQSLNRHLKICSEKHKSDEANKSMTELVTILNSQINDLKKALEKKDNQIDELIKKAGIIVQ